MSDHEITVLSVPRGTPNKAPLNLDMQAIYGAERRLPEIKTVNLATAAELKGTFSEACNSATKYLAWVKFEIMQAQKELELAKAEVILDKLPDELKKMRESGIKDNADLRAAIICRDGKYQECQGRLFSLEAVKMLLESKVKVFERAYWDCRVVAENRANVAAVPNFSSAEGSLSGLQSNFMGMDEFARKG